MNAIVNDHYKYNRIILSIFYNWPYQNSKFIVMKRTIIVIFMTLVWFSQVAAFVTSHFKMSIVNKMLPVSLATFTVLYATIYFYFNDENHKLLWDEILADWNAVWNGDEIKLKMFYASIGRKLTIMMLCTYGVSLIAFSFGTVFYADLLDFISPLNESRSRQLPFKVEYFLDEEEYYYTYLITTLIQLSCMLFVGFSVTTVFWVEMIHIFGLQKLTGYGLERAFKDVLHEDSNVMNEIFRSALITCIQRHQRTIKMRALVQRYYQSPIDVLAIVLAVGTTISLVQYTNSKFKDNKALFELLVVFVQATVHTSFCQILTNNAEKVANKIYSSEWYRVSPKVRKLLPLLLFQAHQPLTINALKIIVISMINLRELLRFWMSYYSVVNNMQKFRT